MAGFFLMLVFFALFLAVLSETQLYIFFLPALFLKASFISFETGGLTIVAAAVLIVTAQVFFSVFFIRKKRLFLHTFSL